MKLSKQASRTKQDKSKPKLDLIRRHHHRIHIFSPPFLVPLLIHIVSSITPDLYNSLPSPLTSNNQYIAPVRDLPHRLRRLRHIPYELTRFGLEQPHSPVVAACHEVVLVELEGGDGGVVCGYAADGAEAMWGRGDGQHRDRDGCYCGSRGGGRGREKAESYDTAVGATGSEC